MKINCTQHIQAEISWQEQLDITEKTLRKLYGWTDKAYVSVDGRLVQRVEYATSHAWTEQEEIREATEGDKALQMIINSLKASRFKY